MRNLIEYFMRMTAIIAAFVVAMTQVGPKDAGNKLTEWWGVTEPLLPSLSLPSRTSTLYISLIFLVASLATLNRKKLKRYIFVATHFTLRRFGKRDDGTWSWRLRLPWEPTANPIIKQGNITRFEIAFQYNPARSEAIAERLLKLDELIAIDIFNDNELNEQTRLYSQLKREILDYVKENLSISEAHSLANPGLAIVWHRPEAFNQQHNSLLHSMTELRQGLSQLHIRYADRRSSIT